MDRIDWDTISACANVVMAATAVIAAWYALRQFRWSIRLHEIDQITRMYKSTDEVMRRGGKGDGWDRAKMRDALNLLELHERLIANGLLSNNAVEFYRDAISINEDLTNIPDDNLILIRNILSNDSRGYRHLIASLKRNDSTTYIINW